MIKRPYSSVGKLIPECSVPHSMSMRLLCRRRVVPKVEQGFVHCSVVYLQKCSFQVTGKVLRSKTPAHSTRCDVRKVEFSWSCKECSVGSRHFGIIKCQACRIPLFQMYVGASHLPLVDPLVTGPRDLPVLIGDKLMTIQFLNCINFHLKVISFSLQEVV